MEFIKFTGNDEECLRFCPEAIDPIDREASLIIPTPDGLTMCHVGDYIVKKNGKYWTFDPSIFNVLYGEELKKGLDGYEKKDRLGQGNGERKEKD